MLYTDSIESATTDLWTGAPGQSNDLRAQALSLLQQLHEDLSTEGAPALATALDRFLHGTSGELDLRPAHK